MENDVGGNTIAIFLIIFVTIAILTVAIIRSTNQVKEETAEKEYVHGRLITLGADDVTVKESANIAMKNANEAMNTLADNSAQIDALAARVLALENKVPAVENITAESRYVSLAYCLTEYDVSNNITLFKCKKYPNQ
jgi:hypothetical protein